jgi:hypothetical protein
MASRFSSKFALMLKATLFLATAFSLPVSAQDCSPDNIVLGSQAEVDDFQLDHGPCDRMVKNLTIEGTDILELDGLEGLASIDGILSISHNPNLQHVDGLASVTNAGNSIVIWDNPELGDLDGLYGITSVGRDLIIRDNHTLSELRGLSRIIWINGSLSIESNGNLKHLGDLKALTRVGATLRIQSEDLNNLDGLSSVTRVGGRLIIFSTTLTEVDGLSGITSVGSDLWILANPKLSNLNGLSGVPAVRDLAVEENPSLNDCQGLVRLVDPIDHYETGPGSAGIPDVGGVVSFLNNLSGCNSVLEILRDGDFFEINAGLNDAWLSPGTEGQGFLIIVFPEIKQIFLTWFTYDTERPPEDVSAVIGEPGHRWLTAQGDYEGSVAVLTLHKTSGGIFDSPDLKPVTEPDGEIFLEFTGCNAGTITYNIPSANRQGVIPIERIVLDNVSLCYLLGNPARDPVTETN